MSRKSILSLAAAASITVASFASQSADARSFAGFGGGGISRMGGMDGGSAGRVFGSRFASFTGHGGRIGPIVPPPQPVFPGPIVGGHQPFPIPLPVQGPPPVIPGPTPGGHLPFPTPIPIPINVPPGPTNPNPGPGPGNPGGPGDHDHHHHHHHWGFIGGVWVVIDDVTNEVVVADPEDGPAPGPCTCLTKTYTPSGLVVFADVCTKESASASVYGNATAATQVPTSPVAATAVPMSVVPTTPDYAGRTYEDYLAANPQLAQPQAAAPQAIQKN